MDECMEYGKSLGGLMAGLKDGWMHACIGGWWGIIPDGWVGGYVDGLTNEWMDEWMDGWKDGRMHG